jgi:hypothetical protein
LKGYLDADPHSTENAAFSISNAWPGRNDACPSSRTTEAMHWFRLTSRFSIRYLTRQ